MCGVVTSLALLPFSFLAREDNIFNIILMGLMLGAWVILYVSIASENELILQYFIRLSASIYPLTKRTDGTWKHFTISPLEKWVGGFYFL